MRSGSVEHLTETDSLRAGSERMFFAALSAYVVRVQVSSLATDTSPRSSTCSTRPVPVAVSYIVVDFVSVHVPSDFRLKSRLVWVRTIEARVIPQVVVRVAVWCFQGMSIVLEISSSPS